MAAWAGARTLAGGKGYATTPLGQLHFRDIGPRCAAAPLLLLHQSPLFMVEFGAVQTSLHALGLRSVAVDTPGYGMSDPPPGRPTIGDIADNLVPLLHHLGLDRVFAAGHHTGACIATALAARHPDRVAGVILHGCPVYSVEEQARFRAAKPWEIGVPEADGSHVMQIFHRIPPKDAGESVVRSWMTAGLLLQASDLGHVAVNAYDMAGDLAKMRAPGLIVSDAGGVTSRMDERACALRPDFAYRLLSGYGTTAIMTAPGMWAEMAAGFMAAHAPPRVPEGAAPRPA